MTVLILGAGEIGSCLGKILQKHHQVLFWDKEPSRRTPNESIEQIVKKADCVIVCIPSSALREALNNIQPFLSPQTPIICLSKGMEPAGALVPDIISQILPHHPFVLMAGPMIAEELNDSLPGYAVCAGDQAAYQVVLALFQNTKISCEYTPDTKSVAFCSVLKNIYSVCLGMTDGLSFSGNTKGYLLGKVLEEWSGLADALSIDPRISWGAAGMADFLATSFSQYSSNRATGEKLAKGEPGQSEGTQSLVGLIAVLQKSAITIPPILNALNLIIDQQGTSDVPSDPRQVFAKIIHRQ